MSETTDEQAHIDYGRRILQWQPARLSLYDDSKMPVSALNAIPSFVAQALDDRRTQPELASGLRDIRWARVPTLAATFALTVFVFLWARDLYGSAAAIGAAALATGSPTLIAHGTLATTDMYFALGVLASLFYFRRYLLTPTFKTACTSAFVLATAQLTKPFAIYLYGVVGCFLLAALLRSSRSPRTRSAAGRSIATYAALAIVSFVVLMNLGFCFDRSMTPIDRYEFLNDGFKRLQTTPILASLPVPIPYPWLQGLDMMRQNERTGESFGNLYLLGELRRVLDPAVRGFKSYYAVTFLYKVPIGLQILMAIGIVSIWKHRADADFMHGEGLLLGGAAVLFVWLSFFNRAQLGIRQILPCVATVPVVAGAAFRGMPSMSRRCQTVLCGLAIWAFVSTASYMPDMIPYMNEWLLDRTTAYTVLADSNLDWGQDADVVKEFVRQNPDVVTEPAEPVDGRILVSANSLVGVAPRWQPYRFLWLRSRHTPVAHVGHGHLLFVVRPGDPSRRDSR